MRLLIVAIAVAVGTAGCFGEPLERAKDQAGWGVIKSDENGVLIARVDASSGDSLTIKASEASNISTAQVTIPAGALSVSTEVTIQEGAPLTDATTLAAAGFAGATATAVALPVDVVSSIPMDATGPLTIAIPLPGATGLQDDPYANLVILHKVTVVAEANKVVYGVLQRSAISIVGQTAQFTVNHFGTFQAVFLIPADATAPVVAKPAVTVVASGTTTAISWNAATDDKTAAENLKYAVYSGAAAKMETVASIETQTKVMDYTAAVKATSVTTPTKSGSYYYNVIVQDEAGNKTAYSMGLSTVADNKAPTVANKALTVSGVQKTKLTVSWNAATDDITAASALKYTIYYVVGSGAFNTVALVEAGTRAAILNGQTSYEVQALTHTTSYKFNVVVEDAVGNKTLYTEKSTATADGTPPTIADTSSFLVTRAANNLLSLTWDAAGESGVNYKIYSKASAITSATGATLVATLTNPTDLSYVVHHATCGSTIHYNVSTLDAAGNEAFYDSMSISIPSSVAYVDGGQQGCPLAIDVADASITTEASGFVPKGMASDGTDVYYTTAAGSFDSVAPAALNTPTVLDGSMSSPMGLTLTGSDVFIADTSNDVINVWDGSSVVAYASSLDTVIDVAVDVVGNKLYAATDTKIYEIPVGTAPQTATLLAGDSAGFADATGTDARFNGIAAIALYGERLFVAETSNRIRVLNVKTKVATTLAGDGVAGFVDATGAGARFNQPLGIATDGHYVYVADSDNHRLRRIDAKTGVVTTIAGNGTGGYGNVADGNLTTSAVLENPVSVQLVDGKIYVGIAGGGGKLRVITP